MPIPDYQTLMLPVLRAAANGEVRVSDVIEGLSDDFGLTEDEREEVLPSGRQRVISNRIHWAKTYLTKAGLLRSIRRAHFQITDRGRAAIADGPERIDISYLSQFPEFIEFRQRSATNETADKPADSITIIQDERTPDEVMRAAHSSIESTLRQEILDRIFTNSPDFFEHLIVDLLDAMGYGGSVEGAGRRLGSSSDGGVE